MAPSTAVADTSSNEKSPRDSRTSSPVTPATASVDSRQAPSRPSHTARRETGSACRISSRPWPSSPAVRPDTVAMVIPVSSIGSISANSCPSK